MNFPKTRAFALLDTTALQRNFCLLQALATQREPNVRTIAVVKANAYGHGAAAVLPALWRAGCRHFAVATPNEALEARTLCPKAEVLVLGYTPPALAPELAAAGITQTVFSADYAAALGAALRGQPLCVHLKIDTGLCRQGFAPEDEAGLLAALNHPNLRPTGLYTHFPCADTDPCGTRLAFRRFCDCRARLSALGHPLFSHAAASAALLSLPETCADGVRPGLALYGIPPVEAALPLAPVLTLCAPVVQVREVPACCAVGYGGDFVTSRPSRIGVLPLGYADGFPRALGGLAVTVRHKGYPYPARVVGRVCMDLLTVDLTDSPAEVGDTVMLWRDVTAIARRLRSIPYEVLTALSPRVERRPLPQNP